jgi:hypothetical protein
MIQPLDSTIFISRVEPVSHIFLLACACFSLLSQFEILVDKIFSRSFLLLSSVIVDY